MKLFTGSFPQAGRAIPAIWGCLRRVAASVRRTGDGITSRCCYGLFILQFLLVATHQGRSCYKSDELVFIFFGTDGHTVDLHT